MDPISAIFVMAVLGGLLAKGVDVATDGLLSAEVGAGVRGAAGYAVRAERDRWGRARAKSREIRTRTPQGQAVQGFLDVAGLFGRTLFGELRRFGSGARSGWETARDQARSARSERRGDEPWPIVRAARSGAVRVREWAEQRARSGGSDLEPHACSRCGRPERDGERFGSFYAVGDVRLCGSCVAWLDCRYPEGWPDDPNEVTEFGEGQNWPEGMPDPDQAPFGGPAVVHPFEPESDDLGPLPPKCPDCGMPLVISTLSDHRMGRDRCHYADMDDDPNEIPKQRPQPPPGFRYVPSRTGDVHGHFTWDLPWPDDDPYADMDDDPDDPNGDPNVPLESTVPNANGDVRCGCCAQLHKPLEPGAHCPNCHLHDQSTPPNGTTPNAPTTRGTSMDINSAPAAIAAWEALGDRWESLQSRADALQGDLDSLKNEGVALNAEIATLADGMGDFAIGGEGDVAASMGEVADSLTSAKEQVDAVTTGLATAKERTDGYTDALHLEYDGPIEAAAGKAADVHAVMQEA